MATDKNGLSADQDKELNTHISELIDAGASDSDIESFTNDYVKKKVVTQPTTTPSESLSQDGAKVLSDVSEQFRKAGTQGEKPLSESGIKNEILKVVPQKDITDETTLDARGNKRNARNLTYKLIPSEYEQKAIQVDESKKPTTLQDAYKSKISDIYKLAEEHKSLSSDYAKNYTIAEVASLDPNVVRLNNLMLQRDNAIQNNEGQKVADLSSEIESLKNAPVDTPTDIQQIVAQSNAQNQGAPQDTPDFRSGFKPKTINEKLKSIGVTPVKTVGELADVRSIAQNMMGDLKKPIESAKYYLDEYKERDNVGVEGLDENGVKVREGIKGAIPAFVDGFVNTSKSMLQGLEYLDATLKGDDTKKIELAKQRWVEENILHPVENKGAIANASNMLGGVAPYAMGGAVLGEAEIVPRMIMDATGMGLSDVGNGYYEGFAKMKDEGKSDEEANDYATKKMAYEGATGAMLGAGLPHISTRSNKIFGVPQDENTVRKFLAEGFGMTTAFTGRKLLGNAYEKYGLGNENLKLSEGLQETAEGALMLHGLMHVLPKAPKAIKDIYDVTIARQFPNIEKRFARGVEKGEITQQQADAITVPLEKKFAIYNAMPEGLTAEQMVSIKPETEQILELSKKEPSAVENPDITKDRIAQLQKTIAEKLGTPLTEKEQKSYEKLQEVKADKEDKLTPSEKSELKHYENRIATAENEKAKLAEEKKAEKEKATETIQEKGVEEAGSVGVGGDVVKGDNPRGGTWEKVITNESDGQGGNIKRTRFKTTRIRKGTGEEVQDQDGTRAGNNGRQMSWEDFQKEFELYNTDGYIDDLFDGRTPESVTIHEIAENDRSGKKGMEVTIDWGKDEKTGLTDNSRLNLEFKPKEQSLKETTKAETTTTNTGVEEGSGVGGDEIFYTGRGKKYEDLKNTKGEFIFFSKNPKISEWYGGDESNVSEAKLDTSNFLDLTTQESKSKFVKENFTDKDIEELYSDEIKYEENTDRFGRKTRESLINKYRERAVENRFSGDGKEQQFLLNKIKEQGHSGVKLLDTHFGKSDISYVIIDKSKIQQSLKETTKAETPKVEAGSGGVGGDVESRKKEMKSENDKLIKRKRELANDRDDVVTGEGKYKNFGKKERDAKLEEIRNEVNNIDAKQVALQKELKVIEAKETGSVELFDHPATNHGSTNTIIYDIKNDKLVERENVVRGKTKDISIEDAAKQKFAKTLRGRNQREINEAYTDKVKAKYEAEITDEISKYKSEQSLKETPKAEPIVAEKPVVENKEVPKVELPKEVINKFKSLNEPQNEGKNGGTDGINTGKSKDGESGNVGKAKTKKADTSSKDSNAEGNEGGEKTKGLKGKGNRIVAKIKGALKHPDYIRALAHEVTDVKDIVLQAFIGGQKINPSYIKELFANSQREWNVRIGLMDGKAPSIKELAHDMWEAHKMNFGEETKVSDQDYVNAIEAVIREHNGKKTMVDDINNRFISEDKIDEEHQKWNEYHRNHEQEVVDESAKILEGIDNEELGNKIANAKDDAEVEKYISEIELKAKQKVDEAIEKYKNEKGEIDSDAVDAIEKEYGKSVAEEVKQSDKFFPFQVEEPTSKRQEMVKDAVQSLIDNGFTKLEQIHQIAKEQLGEGYKKQEIDDAFNAIGKDKVSKEAEPITKGVIGRVSQWLNKTFGGKENVQILGSTKAIMDKAKSLMGGNSNGQPLFMHTPDGKVLGFTHDNKIYLNQEHLNPNTPVHEAGHIWTNWAKENQADHYEKGMDLVNGTDYLAKAKASEFYQKEALKLGKEGSKEYEDYMKHEALAMAIGDKGSKFVTEATRKSFTEWAKELWDSVAKAVGLKDTSAQELQNLTFDELTSRIAKDILSEAPSNYGTSRTIINENRAKLGLGEIGKGKGRTNQETRTVASEIYNQEQANELVDEVLSPDYNKFERTLSANELLVLEEHLRLQELSIKQNDKDRLSIKEKLAKEPDNTEYMGSLAVLESNRQMDIDNKIRTEYAITNAKTATAISLQERGIVTNEHGVLKQLVNGIKDAWGKDIPEWAKEKISDLEKLHSEAVAKIELLNDKYIRGKAEKEIETIKKGAKGKATKEQILERSKQRLAEMIANRNKVEFSVEGDIEKTLDKELFKAIIPDIRELINSKLAEGKLTTLDEISESVANDYKDVIDGVKASDIIDVLGGVYSEKRTKSTLQKQAAELRKQAGEARRLENAQKGIFEKGQPQGEKSETSKEIARLKSIHDAKAKLEDLEKGIIRKTKERGASDPEVVALQKQAAELRKQVINNSPELSSEQLFKKALAIERQIKEGNFNKSVEERKKFESNEDWIKANRSLANARNQLNELKRDALNSNKTKIMKLEDWVTRFGRNMIFIGNFATFAKLAFASSQGFVLRPIQESVIGKITKKAFPFLADKAPVEGTLENDYKQFYGDFLSPRQLWATIRDVSKSSTTELSKKNDPYVDESINMADFLSDDIKAKYPNAERVLRTTSHIGNRIIDMSSAGWHQIVKDPIKRATYNASFGNIMKYYADHNLNYNDPMLIEQAEQIAWIRAKQEIFLEGNAWGGSLKEYAQKQKKIALEMVRLGKENPALKKEWKANWEYTKGAIADVLVPIATVPANIARRSAMANPVSLVSSIAEAKKMNNIIKESLGEVTNEEADAIILKIKQRSIGSALFILGGLAGAGWLGKKYSAGGLYSPFYPDWKRDKDEPVSNELNIAGEEVPHSMQHITLFTTYQMAATFGVMFNHFYEKEMKDNSNRAEYLNILMAVLDAGLATGGAIAGTVPTYGKVQSVAAGFATGKMDKVFRDTKKQFGVQKISGALDYTGILNYSKDELDAQELEKKRNKEKEDSSKERHDNMRKAN